MTTFLDTNVLVYAFDRSDERKREVALAILAEADFVVSAQVLNEFFVAVTRKLDPPMSREAAHEAVKLLAVGRVVPIDKDLVANAIDTAITSQLSSWDAAIICAAVRSGCEVVLSEDMNDGQLIAGVTVRNPFRH